VPKDEIEQLLGKHMVESVEHGIEGVACGAFRSDEFINVSNKTYRICAPVGARKMQACIFWTKSSSADISPSWAKVVSIIISY
jgi:hypothetical protein